MRNSRTGSVQAAVRDTYAAYGGLEAIKEAIGVSVATLSYGTEINEHRPGGIGINYLDQISRMEPACAAVLAHHFASLAGGVFQPVDETYDACLASHTATVASESGQAVAAALGALGSKCPQAIDRALEEADDLVEAGVGLRARLTAKRAALGLNVVELKCPE